MERQSVRHRAPAVDAVRPVSVFRAALLAAATEQRKSRARSPERVAAVSRLCDADLGMLVSEFEALLAESAEVSRLVERLHAALARLAPEPRAEEEADVDAD